MSTDPQATVTDSGHYDALTAALSRAPFIAELHAAKGRADRAATGFVLCLVDVDRLRNVNDRHGQAAGDNVLREIARRALAVLALPRWRELKSVLARYDGDSLVALLPGCRLNAGQVLAEALRRRVAGEPFAGGLGLTVSAAVAAYQSGESVDDLLARTERTLHLAKQFGPDRVETAWTRETRGAPATVTAIDSAAASPLSKAKRRPIEDG